MRGGGADLNAKEGFSKKSRTYKRVTTIHHRGESKKLVAHMGEKERYVRRDVTLILVGRPGRCSMIPNMVHREVRKSFI